MTDLSGKTAIITGASRGIGRASALAYAAAGANVVLGARTENDLATVADEIRSNGGKAAHLAGDITDETYAKGLVEYALGTYGGLDIAFNNAGLLGAMGDINDMSNDDWNATITGNLTAGFWAAKYQIPALIAHGGTSLIFTSSFVGVTNGMPGMAAYGAAKAGLVGMVRCLAVQYGAQGLRVNALLPGGTDTDMAKEFGDSDEAREFVRSLHGLKRMADPSEIANAALFLASPASSFVTGTAFMVDGGVSINKT